VPPRGPTRIAEELWVEARRLRFAGVETGTRMTFVRLADRGLFVHSPVALDEETREAVDALGPVKAIVAPSRFHHLYVEAWSQAYPEAVLCACPGLERKRPDVRWDRVLGDRPEEEWQGEIEQVLFSARPLESEVVFFHPPSRTLICADLVFHLAAHPSFLTRVVARLIGNTKPGATWLERLLIRDRVAAREQIDRMLAWNPERIVLAHGDIVDSGGAAVLREAYAWL
jgi:glyoxylase-like metal-dependent hydrolase (beta-lactamase superfamily II)